MSKQVKTPRFYVDMVSFLHATGDLDWNGSKGGAELLYMNPSNPYIRESTTTHVIFKIGKNTNRSPKTSFGINFAAVLNHNLASDDSGFKINGIRGFATNGDDSDWENLTSGTNFGDSVLNSNWSGGRLYPTYNGTSIFTLNDTIEGYWRQFDVRYDGDDTLDLEYNHQLGSLVVGKYFDCPNSPDLNLTMSRRFDGIKKQKTIGGKTLPSIYYDGPVEWEMNGPDGTYKYPPFELDLATGIPDLITDDEDTPDIDESNLAAVIADFNQRAKSGLGRKGLRSWKLTFSYISEDNMWMDNEVSSKVTSDSIDDGEIPTGGSDPNPMLSDDSFNFVWNCTLGGSLPFIFQPDNTNNNPDQFSICTFRDSSLSVKQVAFNTYSLSITIDEVA